jgi:hypothetical protein
MSPAATRRTPMRWIRQRTAAAGLATKLGNHSFRAIGIIAYLKNGGTLEKVAARAEPCLDEVERIVI